MHDLWSEQVARGVFEAWRASGLSVDRFAREQGFGAHRLRYWKEKFERKSTALVRSRQRLALLPVSVHHGRPVGEPVAIFLRTGQIVKVGRGFDEEAFSRVVAVLEGA